MIYWSQVNGLFSALETSHESRCGTEGHWGRGSLLRNDLM